MPGKFITFEGGEGCGKSTQIALLYDVLVKQGIPVIKTREPGGSPGAEMIRNLLVSGDKDSWQPMAETLLFYAARLDHVERVIRPALAQEKTVLCDRFADSTMVYQGIGKGLTIERVRELHRLTLGDFTPDVTLLLDMDPAMGLARANARRGNENRFESMDIAFHTLVREGFLSLAQAEPQRFAIIDASQSLEAVHAQILDALKTPSGVA